MAATDETAEQSLDAVILNQIVQRDPRGSNSCMTAMVGRFALAYRLSVSMGAQRMSCRKLFSTSGGRGRSYDTRRGTVRTWLLTIVHHRAIDHLRSARSKMGRGYGD